MLDGVFLLPHLELLVELKDSPILFEKWSHSILML